MTCKDCVHYIFCKDGSPYIEQTEDKHCRHFKNKADVVELPCKVGSKVYIIAEVSKQVVEATVIGVWLYYNNVCIITDYGTIHNNSIGKTVFLTREEAEQKLKGGAKE